MAFASGIGFAIGAQLRLRPGKQCDAGNREDNYDCKLSTNKSPSQSAEQSQERNSGQGNATRARGSLNPLSRALLLERTSETFSGGYMTLLAIIQGVALAALVTTLYDRISVRHFSSASALSHANLALQACATLAGIIIVTEQYFLFVRIIRWQPVIYDTMAPYLIGLGEVSEAVFIGKNEYWWASAAVLLLAGSFAFGYTWLRISRTDFGSLPERYEPFKRSVGRQAIAGLIMGLASFGLCLSSVPHSTLTIPTSYQWIFPLCSFGTIAGAVLMRRFSLPGINRWSLRDGINERLRERRERQHVPMPYPSAPRP